MNSSRKSYYLKLYKSNKRPDRETLDSFRPLKIEYGISNTAEGSARITLGNTIVLAGVKMELGKPYPDTPNQGSIQVGAELVPMSNPDFEPGPPSIKAIELARVVDRGIRESKAIDLKKLCITPKEKSWTVVADIVTINDDGNLFDASALAVLAALRDTKMPLLKDDVVDYKTKTDTPLEMERIPISITVLKTGEFFIVDPTSEEESISEARLTIALTENGEIAALQKGGDTPLTEDEVFKMIDLAQKHQESLRAAL